MRDCQIYQTINSEQTKQIAADLAEQVRGGEVFALYGDLGYGKTTFTQGFARALGITQPVTSPTFLIVKQYTVPNHSTIKKLHHVDLYRLENDAALQGIGLEDMLNDPTAVTIIEWPEKMGTLLPTQATEIRFQFLDESARKIEVSTYHD